MLASPVAPYTGAWIEIPLAIASTFKTPVAPYTGAWIEICHPSVYIVGYSDVAPYTGAWIEIW